MKNLDHVFSFSEALQEIKHQYFTGNDETGLESSFGIPPVTDGAAFSVGHLFAATVIMVALLLIFSLLGYMTTLLVAWIVLRKHKSYRDQNLKVCLNK